MDLDDITWKQCDSEDLWIFDKLILSRKLGYICGPSGVLVPAPDYYIVRPITNIDGMGACASIKWLTNNRLPLDRDDQVMPGYFWCEVFTGRHLSVDYVHGDQVLCVEGIRTNNNPLYKWSKWERVDDFVPFPKILFELDFHHENINCEFIGGKLIEVHLRHNPDFQEGQLHVIPVWEGESSNPPKGYIFKKSPDFNRLGFFIPE